MASRRARNGALAVLSCVVVLSMVPPSARCQATVAVDPATNTLHLEGLNSDQLKQLIGDAAQKGEINVSDANELIAKLNDVDTLMQQFDFIQEQERRMVSRIGSSFH